MRQKTIRGGGSTPDAVTAQTVNEQNDEVPEDHRFEVGDALSFQNAFDTIYNTNTDDKYEIHLTKDIEVYNKTLRAGDGYSFPNPQITIYGGHTITYDCSYQTDDSLFHIRSGTITFGKPDDATSGITFVNNASTAGSIIGLVFLEGGHLNLYHCTFHNNQGYVYGVVLNGNLSSDEDSTLTMTDCLVEGFLGTYAGVMTQSGTLTMNNCTIRNCGIGADLQGTTFMNSCTIENCSNGVTLWSKALTMNNSTIQNCNADGSVLGKRSGGGVYAYSGTLAMNNSRIQNCSAVDYGGGVYGDSLTMDSGSKITGCSAEKGGGVYASGSCTLNLAKGTVCNNTATEAGDDIYLYYAGSSTTLTLPDAAAMDANYQSSGRKIDGYYPDNTQSTRYTHTKHVDPIVDSSGYTFNGWHSYGLVASYNVNDIVFDYSNAGSETDTCGSYSDAGKTAAIAAAPAGDKVYLTYNGTALAPDEAAGEVLYWDVVTGNEEPVSVYVYAATDDTPAYFVMPEGSIGGKVVVTPKVTAAADIPAPPADPDAPAGGDDAGGSSGDSGAAGIVAGALLGTATYLVGTDIWLNHLYGYIPEHRIQLAEALWNRADCPAPASTELYPDMDEDDEDAQAAARWCVEQELMKDYHKTDKDGNEEVTFKPARYVFRPQAIRAWYKLEKLLSEQEKAQQAQQSET